MESGDRILVAAGLTAAVVVGALVFWSPGGAPKSRKRRGQIAGLQNMGRTCFLNTVLQALAACPSFIAWMQKYCKAGTNNSMITTLHTVTEVVNGTHPTARGTPVCPLGVLRCLRSLGWVISEEQQDAHELLHVLLSCVEEEVQAMAKKPGCLTDALGLAAGMGDMRADSTPATPSASMPGRPSSAATNINDEPEIIEDDDCPPPGQLTRCKELRKGVSRSFCHLSSAGLWRPIPVVARPPPPGPFHGTLATRLQCTVCSNKTPIRYDKFDSVSLTMGDSILTSSLVSMLRSFTAPEILKGVQCDSCSKTSMVGDVTTKHIKSVSFGKLPNCLCLHIARLVWTQAGLSKRSEFVAFPEILSLSPFTQMHTPKKDPLTSLNSEVGNIRSNAHLVSQECDSDAASYMLTAAVVHVGGPRSGHFVTYRRGNGFESSRWFYTSDIVVHEVSLQEVLSCSAYLLFYERRAQPVVSARFSRY